MRAGELRHRITLQKNNPAPNSIGEAVDTWTDLATVWAAIEPLSGNRLFQAQQANSEIQGVVRIRYRSDVLATMRIVHIARYFQVLSIIDTEERHQELHLFYKELAD